MSPHAYAHAVETVHLVETHISWILLTGEFAYKIKRPVTFPFVDLRSVERRAFLCKEEVRLNRRFAAEIYIGVCNITSDEHGARFDGKGRVVEHAVKMVQFERREQLDALLAAQQIAPGELETFGDELAGIHSNLPSADPAHEWGRPVSVRETIVRNLDECTQASRGFGGADLLAALRQPLEKRLDSAIDWMSERRAAGKVRECHGDLHCSNIVRLQSRLRAFDCLEFDPALRWIDVADEVAFLLADLDSFHRPAHVHAFLSGYLARSGDYSACRFLHLYAAHRSLVRAKVTALAPAVSGDPTGMSVARERYDIHLACARAYLSPKEPVLILMSGLSGSGKTSLAKALARPFGAVHIRSDIERKRLAGLSASDRSGSGVGQDLYSSEMNQRLQQHLLRSAESTLAGGYTTIVDATFSRRGDRRQFADLAKDLGVAACVVHCHAPLDVLRSRIEERARRSDDPSEADLAVLEWQQKHYEPLEAGEPLQVFEADTNNSLAGMRLKGEIGDWRA
jgi:aminoglycoside phosphotransferase family enzyme/predicted kinase